MSIRPFFILLCAMFMTLPAAGDEWDDLKRQVLKILEAKPQSIENAVIAIDQATHETAGWTLEITRQISLADNVSVDVRRSAAEVYVEKILQVTSGDRLGILIDLFPNENALINEVITEKLRSSPAGLIHLQTPLIESLLANKDTSDATVVQIVHLAAAEQLLPLLERFAHEEQRNGAFLKQASRVIAELIYAKDQDDGLLLRYEKAVQEGSTDSEILRTALVRKMLQSFQNGLVRRTAYHIQNESVVDRLLNDFVEQEFVEQEEFPIWVRADAIRSLRSGVKLVHLIRKRLSDGPHLDRTKKRILSGLIVETMVSLYGIKNLPDLAFDIESDVAVVAREKIRDLVATALLPLEGFNKQSLGWKWAPLVKWLLYDSVENHYHGATVLALLSLGVQSNEEIEIILRAAEVYRPVPVALELIKHAFARGDRCFLIPIAAQERISNTREPLPAPAGL